MKTSLHPRFIPSSRHVTTTNLRSHPACSHILVFTYFHHSFPLSEFICVPDKKKKKFVPVWRPHVCCVGSRFFSQGTTAALKSSNTSQHLVQLVHQGFRSLPLAYKLALVIQRCAATSVKTTNWDGSLITAGGICSYLSLHGAHAHSFLRESNAMLWYRGDARRWQDWLRACRHILRNLYLRRDRKPERRVPSNMLLFCGWKTA